MILFLSFVTLLIASSVDAQRIKGSRLLLQPNILHAPSIVQAVSAPVVQAPVVAAPVVVGKGGVAGKTVHHTAVVEDPISGAPVVVEKVSRVGGIKGGGYGTRIGGIKGGGLPALNRFAALRPTYRSGVSALPYGLTGLDYFSYPNRPLAFLRGPSKIGGLATGGLPAIGQSIVDPISQFSVADAQLHTNVFGLRRPIYRSGVSALPYGLTGLDYFSYPNRPLALLRGPSKIGGLATGGLAAVGHSPIIQEAISPISQFSVDDAQHNLLSRPLYRTGVSSLPYGLTGLDYFSYPNRPLAFLRGPSKIGGLATGGLAAIGHSPIVQETVSPISQFSVDDAQHNLLARPLYRTGVSSLPYGLTGLDYFSYPNRPLSLFGGPSKIGRLATGGLAAIGQSPIVAPISQVHQEHLGDSAVQTLVDPHVGEVTQVKETLVEEPLTGEIHKVTEVTKGNLAQHNIADAIVQESISSGLGGAGYGYSPRVSFLSSYPYDAPDAGLLRSVIARPVVQHQVEQFHV